MVEKRAFGTLGLVDGLGDHSLFDQSVHGFNSLFGEAAQILGKFHLAAALALGVENGSLGNVQSEHFFETQRLGAKLGVVVVELAAFALFVFNWINAFDIIRQISGFFCCVTQRELYFIIGFSQALYFQGFIGSGVPHLNRAVSRRHEERERRVTRERNPFLYHRCTTYGGKTDDEQVKPT